MSSDLTFSGQELAPGVFIFENAFDNCEEILRKAKEVPESRVLPAMLQDGSVKTDIRNNTLIDITPSFDMDIIWWQTSQKLWEYGIGYSHFYRTGFSGMESPQLLQYEKGQGFYVPHSDNSMNYPRNFSSILYLNDVEEGGETCFTRFDISVKPKAGRLILFPANFIYEHEAKMPISGPKNVIVTWYRPE